MQGLTQEPLPRRASAAERSEGYFLSSLDLRAGLETRVMAASMVPLEVWGELQRLQSLWGAAAPYVAV